MDPDCVKGRLLVGGVPRVSKPPLLFRRVGLRIKRRVSANPVASLLLTFH